MAGSAAVWGIDLGRCALKAIKLRPGSDGQVEIVACAYFEHATMLSQPDADRHALVSQALEKFLSRHDISKDKIVIGVPGQTTLSRFSKLPPVEAKKIPDIVKYEADQQIPFDLDEVIWDYQTFQEEDSPDVEVGIFAMKRELIRDYLLPFEQVGIEPIAVQSSPLALYNAMHFEGRLDEHASVLLDLGAENTDLIVATKHGLWTRTIPMGGNKFTEVLVSAFKLNFAKAENLKRTAATSKYARQVFQAMRPAFAELVQELSRSLGFYRSTHRESELKRIFGVGNAFDLPGLQKYLQQNLQLPVERPKSFTKANASEVENDEAFVAGVSGFTVAYGLALQGLDISKGQADVSAIKSNLLPPEIVQQVIWRKKRPFFAASAACLLLAAGIVWIRQTKDMSALMASKGKPVASMTLDRATQLLSSGVPSNLAPREEAQTVLAMAKAFNTELGKYKSQGAVETQQSVTMIELQRNKAVWPRILSAIHAALPPLPPELAGAEDPDAYRRALSSAGAWADRENREQVFIEQFDSEYSDDLDSVDLLDKLLKTEAPDVIKPIGGAKRAGFLITMECRTPNADTIRFAADTFRAKLLKTGRKPGTGFYVNRVVFVDGRKFSQSKKSSGSSKARPSGKTVRRRGSSRRKSKQTSKKRGVVDGKYDPVTDEPMGDDWVFTLKFDVVLGDLPEQKPAGEGA